MDNINELFRILSGADLDIPQKPTHYEAYPGMKITSAVNEMCEKYKSFWLLDNIHSYRQLESVQRSDMVVIQLDVEEDESAKITVMDGDLQELYNQTLSYTDFPKQGARLYFIDGVVMLPSDY